MNLIKADKGIGNGALINSEKSDKNEYKLFFWFKPISFLFLVFIRFLSAFIRG